MLDAALKTQGFSLLATNVRIVSCWRIRKFVSCLFPKNVSYLNFGYTVLMSCLVNPSKQACGFLSVLAIFCYYWCHTRNIFPTLIVIFLGYGCLGGDNDCRCGYAECCLENSRFSSWGLCNLSSQVSMYNHRFFSYFQNIFRFFFHFISSVTTEHLIIFYFWKYFSLTDTVIQCKQSYILLTGTRNNRDGIVYTTKNTCLKIFGDANMASETSNTSPLFWSLAFFMVSCWSRRSKLCKTPGNLFMTSIENMYSCVFLSVKSECIAKFLKSKS